MKATAVIQRLTALTLMTLVLTTASCGSHKSTTTKQANLSGVIKSEAGQPIAGATVTSSGNGAVATTDASGKYSFGTTADELVSVTVSADSYATLSRGLLHSTDTQDFTMRAIDLTQTVKLPNGSDAAIELNVARGGANLAVSLPPDALVNANGNVATGDATVKITFWNPNESLDSSPAELVAHSNDPNDEDAISQPMQSFGMFDITIEQGGQELQVGPNQVVPVAHKMNSNVAGYAVENSNFGLVNYMFYLDPKTKGWRVAADAVFDGSTGTISTNLPHLSSWNYDYFTCPYPSYCTWQKINAQSDGCKKDCQAGFGGGCIKGTIKDKSGNPVVGKGTLWLFSDEGIYDITVATDSTGAYCYNAGLRVVAANGAAGPIVKTNDLPNFSSAYRDPTNSAAANPITSNCMHVDGQYASWNKWAKVGDMVQWNKCGYVDNTFSGKKAPMKAAAPLSVTTISLCDYCPGTGPSRCPVGGGAVTHNCGTGGTGGGISCTKLLKLGDACGTDPAACCPTSTVCADGICVPLKD